MIAIALYLLYIITEPTLKSGLSYPYLCGVMQYCVSRYLLQIERNNLDAAAQAAQGWGAKVIDMLSTDLMARYGNDSGYSI